MRGYLLLFLLSACDGAPAIDAGRDAGRDDDGGERDAGVDASASGAPIVIATLPEDGDEGVDPATRMLVLFNEEMDPSAGDVRVEPAGITLDATDAERAIWIGDEDLGIDGTRTNIGVVFSFPAPLQGGVEHEIAVRGFTDAGGTPMAEPFAFRFVTLDAQAPRAVRTMPAEGASGLSAAAITEIVLELDEEMNTAVGRATLAGGPGRLGDPSWDAAARTITWPVSGLAYGESYRILFTDFVDRNGNDWDPDPYLNDGALDFTTGPDLDAPVVSFSAPSEGQRGVNPALEEVEVAFSEPMDQRVTSAMLRRGASTLTIDGVWRDETTIVFDVGSEIALRTDYSLDLSGFDDAAGNALDGSVYLGDGRLDFSVGDDTFGPRAIESTPVEGETDVDFALGTISVRFDEPMNATIVRAPLSDGASSTMVTGTWTDANTRIAFDARTILRAGRTYELDLRGLEDEAGNTLDASHAYLGDGRLNFSTIPPRGDSCVEALSVGQATLIDGVYEWTIAAGSYNDSGATDSCDDDGSAATDLVIAYEKTSGTLASGGALLHVEIESNDTTDLNFEIRSACESGTIVCQDAMESGGATIDVGPGTYFVWIAKETVGAFPGARVRISEPTAWPAGESCEAPYDDRSPSPTYLAPTDPGEPHIWQIPAGDVRSFDRGAITNGAADISCSTDHGHDAVIRFDARAGSVIEVRAIPTDIRFSAADLNVELSIGCDPLSAGFVSLACAANFDRVRTLTGSSPAGGPVYVWVSSDDTDLPFPGATVSITEILVSPGESCAAARDIATPLALDSTRSIGGGTCLGTSAPITWFRYTPAEDIVLVSTDASGPMLLVDQETSETISCADAAQPSAAFVRAGRSLCIGLPNASGATSITTAERAYSGVVGSVTDLGIRRALNERGLEESWTSESWMTTSSDTIFLGETDDVFFVPKAGGTRAVMAEGIATSHLGDAGFVIGGALFGVDDAATMGSTRLYRLWDGMRFPWMPEVWDTGTTWPAEEIFAAAYDGTAIVLATDADTSSEATFFYEAVLDASEPAAFMGLNQTLQDVIGVAADATYYYVLGGRRSGGMVIDGVHRVRRAQISDPAAAVETLARFDLGTFQGNPVFIDDDTSATILYARQVDAGDPNRIHVVLDPGGATPLYIGSILTLGTTNDYAWTYDRTDRAIYLFESETDPNGRIVRVQ